MATFRGQARSQGFDPVKLPDTARQMLEASKRKRLAQERAYELDLRQRSDYSDAMRRKSATEERAFESNIKQMDSYQRAYRDQLKENYARLEEKNKQKTQQDIQNLSRLGQFSTSALKLAGDLKDNYEKQQEDFGRSLIAKYRVSKEEYNQLRMSEADLQAEGAANNQIVEILKNKGASPDEIASIRKLDGWRLYGAQQEWAISGGKNFANYLKKNADTKIDIDGVQLSLNEAKTYQDGDLYGIVQDRLIAKYAKPYGNLDPTFASQYFYSQIDQAIQTNNAAYISERQNIVRANEQNARLTEIKIIAAGHGDIMTYTQSQGLDYASNTKQMLSDVQVLVDRNVEDAEKVLQLFLQSPSGQNPKQTNQQIYIDTRTESAIGTQIKVLIDRIDAEKRSNYETKEGNNELAHKQRLEKLEDNGFYDLPPATQQQVRLQYQKTHGRDLNQNMVSFMNQSDGLSDEVLEDHFYTTILNGASITPEQIKRLGKNASPKLVASLVAKVPENSVYQQKYKKTHTSFVHELKSSLSRAGSINHGIEVNNRADEAMKEVYTRFTEYRSNNRPEAAYTKALQDVMDLIRAGRGKNPSGPFAVKVNSDGIPLVGDEGGFQAFESTANEPDAILYNTLSQDIKDDADIINTKFLFGKLDDPKSWISKFDSVLWRNSRAIPWYIKKAAEQFKVTPEKLINTQLLKYNKQPVDFSLNRYSVPEEAIPPNLRRIINSHPSTGKKSRAFQMTHAMRDPGDRYRPMLNLMASQESSNDTVHGGYDALNTGGYGRYPEGTSTGERNLGRPLTSFTVKEIMNMQQSGKLMAAGRYQFVPGTLIEQVRDQNIDPSALFDEATQDQLAIGYLNSSIGTFRSTGQDVVYGLGQRWHGLQNVSRAEMQRNIDFLDQDPRVNDNFSGLDYRESVLKSHYNK